MNQQPLPKQINNGILYGRNAMPLKDLTSDNTDSFAQNRTIFQKSYVPPVDLSVPQVTQTIIQRQAPGIQHGFNIQGGATVNQKKWIGGNRDSSQITRNRRVNTTGKIQSTLGEQSFTNKSDNNTRNEALARVRGGGYTVPPKVTQKNVQQPIVNNIPTDPTKYYRIVSAGLNALTNSLNTTGVQPGFYTYTPTNMTGTRIFNSTSVPIGFYRSYNVLTINKTTGITDFRNFDVFGLQANADTMANYLTSLDINTIVIVATFDEPSISQGGILPTSLVTAIQNIGGSSDYGTVTDGFIQYRSAYILVGSPGLGVDNGLEFYKGAVLNDPDAFIDVRISVFEGEYTKIYSSIPENT